MKKTIILILMIQNLQSVWADSAGHEIYEKTFGPIGTFLGLFTLYLSYLLIKKEGFSGTFGEIIKWVTYGILCISIGSLAFGLHGFGLISGEMSRVIERSFRFFGLIIFFIGMYNTYKSIKKINKKKYQKIKEHL